ncbi:rhodanese-like domain-containing protein [Glaesserella parasuis]|nr:rhodanese-like domain-containing protein [Glaesserella parasuis]MDG6235794.1 rhodanese-like domain-containing protein [Glaesserella parasuis]
MCFIRNLSEPKVIEQNLLNAGINKNKTIILYSDNQLAAYRIFWALKWAGVEDVRVLNGNFATWTKAGFPAETTVNTPTPVSEFGAVIPVNPQINISMPADAMARQQQGLKLISNRAWDEYTGKISGYDYILGKGEPQGAIWGFAGSDSSNMVDYYDLDGTLRNPNEIFALWKGQNINQGDQLAFYCGTGWRAGISWFMTQLAGWKDTYVYDGGWNVWQMDSTFPVQKGAPNEMVKPDSKN